MSTPRPEAAAIHLQFDDNALLPDLFGEHDQHLARIEQQLGVSMRTIGNQLSIHGPTAATTAARAALSALYERLKHGKSVDAAEVDAAVRFAADAGTASEPVQEVMVRGGAEVRTRKRIISPRTPNQKRYIEALAEAPLVFGLGPAGTGKTYLAVAVAVSMMMTGEVDRIVLSRPAVEAGERLGFLPGDLREKVDPYLRPLYDALYDMLPGEQVLKRLETGEIEVAPLAFMRGRTLANAFIIVDEAQNTTTMQMKMLLTRIGENSRMAVTGDLSQIDLPPGVTSGLREAATILEDVEGVRQVRFDDGDVVRHHLVTRIVQAYDAKDRADAGPTGKES